AGVSCAGSPRGHRRVAGRRKDPAEPGRAKGGGHRVYACRGWVLVHPFRLLPEELLPCAICRTHTSTTGSAAAITGASAATNHFSRTVRGMAAGCRRG